MRLAIQIPCWNEREWIARTLASLPGRIEGIDSIDVIVVDDGSTDGTVEAAAKGGADAVIALPRHSGLGDTFLAGVNAALERDVDILVNTDADMQYPSSSIGDLVTPILQGTADMVIGDRLSYRHPPFSPLKMALERFGTAVVRLLSGTNVRDAASGFRAFNRDALEAIFLHGSFSYTMETLMVAGVKKLRVHNVSVTVNPPQRPSRLFRSIPDYILRSTATILRAYLMYYPLRFFAGIGSLFLLGAFLLGTRFLYFFFLDGGGGHIQSLILLVVFAFMGFQSIVLGLIGDIISANRRLLEHLRLQRILSQARADRRFGADGGSSGASAPVRRAQNECPREHPHPRSFVTHP